MQYRQLHPCIKPLTNYSQNMSHNHPFIFLIKNHICISSTDTGTITLNKSLSKHLPPMLINPMFILPIVYWYVWNMYVSTCSIRKPPITNCAQLLNLQSQWSPTARQRKLTATQLWAIMAMSKENMLLASVDQVALHPRSLYGQHLHYIDSCSLWHKPFPPFPNLAALQQLCEINCFSNGFWLHKHK
jgi:hypothetical protein